MSVIANNRDVASESTGHKVIYMSPSVCMTPAAPSPIPVPYPILTPAGVSKLDDDSRTVKIGNKPVFTVDAEIHDCTGNEAGTMKEVVSHQTRSACYIIDGSTNVKADGAYVVFTGSNGMGNRM